MRRAKLSRSAAGYLRAEIARIAERNPPAARKVKKRIEEIRVLLDEYPNLGEATILEGTRRFAGTRYGYILYHRAGRRTVEITEMRHGRQRPFLAPDHDPVDPEETETSDAGPGF